MTFIESLVARCKEERRRMQESLEKMESGQSQPLTKSKTGWVDATVNRIANYRRIITGLDALIARHPDAGTRAAGLPRVERDQAKLEGVNFVRLRVWEEPPGSPNEMASVCGSWSVYDQVMGMRSSQHPSLPVAWAFEEAWNLAMEKGIPAIWIDDTAQLFDFKPWEEVFSR